MGGSYGTKVPSDLEICDHIVGKGNVSLFVITCNPSFNKQQQGSNQTLFKFLSINSLVEMVNAR
jgi:hypothetical protein